MAKKKMSETQAIALQGYFIGLIGSGYHPDNKLCEYVNTSKGSFLFSSTDIAKLQPLHDEMVEVLDLRVYSIGLNVMSDVWGDNQ